MHSRPKLALAVLTSPAAAFQEILERKLLGTAIVIAALAGAISTAAAVALAAAAGPVQFFTLGKDNPLCWLGLLLLYAFVLRKLLKWSGADVDYVTLITVMGWSQITLALAQVAIVAGGIASSFPNPNQSALSLLGAASLCLTLWYVAALGTGIHVATRQPLFRAVMSYIIVAAAALIAFSLTYRQTRLGPFQGALPSIQNLADAVAKADQTGWLAASVVGLVLGAYGIGRALGWDKGTIARLAVILGLVGALAFAGYEYALSKAGYYAKLAHVQRLYDEDKFDEAAARLVSLLPLAANNVGLMLDIADTYYLAGKSEPAIDYYTKFTRAVKKAKLGKDEAQPVARATSGIGAAYDLARKYDLAIAEFEKAAKLWPEFRDPWVRLAVTYDRMGDYEEAIDAANHAVKKLDSEAIVAWVALAEAFVNAGDTKQAKAAIAMVAGKDDLLAKRIGKKAEDWKVAVDKLTPKDLSFPLEKEPAQPPPAPEAKAKPAPRKR